MSDKFKLTQLAESLKGWLKAKSPGTAVTPAAPGSGSGPLPVKKNVNQRWLIVGGIVAVGVAAIAGMASDDPRKNTAATTAKKADERQRMVDVTPKELDRRSWQAQSMLEMERFRRDLEKISKENQRLQSELGEVRRAAEEAQKKGAESPSTPIGVTPPPRPRGAAAGSGSEVAPAVTPGAALPPGSGIGPAPVPGGVAPIDVGAQVPAPPQPLVSRPAPRQESKNDGEGDAASNAASEEHKAKVSVKESPYAGMLPPGAFAEVALLHGLDAATGSVSMANPQPILLNVQNHATLPGAARYQLRSCFVLGSGFGDLSAERVYIQLSRLSCVDKNNRLMLAADIQGYVVDSDGKLGMRGTVVDRQGAKLAKSMLAGFAEGLASALKMSQGSVATSPLGSISSVSGAEAVRSAGLQGAATGASQLSQFYLKEAAQMFPVLSVDGGRLATVVIQSGASLKWGPQDAIYETKITPTGGR